MAVALILHGRVQGVFCRAFCSEYAKRMGLRGSASNLRDGTVRVLLSTEDRARIESYKRSLMANPARVYFWGRIESIDESAWSGPISGDYLF